MNITYGIQMEMLEGNLLKRSVFDVNFENPEVSNLLTVSKPIVQIVKNVTKMAKF